MSKQRSPIEHNPQRILTTAQLAEAYGTDPHIISNNFTRNKDRYTIGKHYFCLEGEPLKQFKDDLAICKVVGQGTETSHQIDDSLKGVDAQTVYRNFQRPLYGRQTFLSNLEVQNPHK